MIPSSRIVVSTVPTYRLPEKLDCKPLLVFVKPTNAKTSFEGQFNRLRRCPGWIVRI